MTAVVLKFPPRGVFVNAVRVEREADADGWVACRGCTALVQPPFASEK